MAKQDVRIIKDWFDGMRVNVRRGMKFARQVSDKGDLDEDNPLFLATCTGDATLRERCWPSWTRRNESQRNHPLKTIKAVP